MCKSPLNSLDYDLNSVLNKKHLKTFSRPLHFLKLKKIQGLFNQKWNSRTFQGLCKPGTLMGEGIVPNLFLKTMYGCTRKS